MIDASAFKDCPVLVTGAAGCIGAWTVKLLSDVGAVPIVFDLTENIQLTQDYFIDIIDQIWIAYSANDTFLNQNLDHWLFASISLLIFLYYSFRFFGNNLGERIKNLFLITFFINSILLSFVINEYSIFLFFPFLVTLVKIISELKDNLFFETVVLIAIILNSYPYNFLTN